MRYDCCYDNDNDNVDYSFLQGKKKTTNRCDAVFICVYIFSSFLGCAIRFRFILYRFMSVLIYVFVENIDLYIVGFFGKKKKRKKENKQTKRKQKKKGGRSGLRSGLLMEAWTRRRRAIFCVSAGTRYCNQNTARNTSPSHTHSHTHSGHALGMVSVCH